MQAKAKSPHQPPGLAARAALPKQRTLRASATPGLLCGEVYIKYSHAIEHVRRGPRCISLHPVGVIAIDLPQNSGLLFPKDSRSPRRCPIWACKSAGEASCRTCFPSRGLDLKYLSKGGRRWGRGVLDHESWQDAAAVCASPPLARRWITERRPSCDV